MTTSVLAATTSAELEEILTTAAAPRRPLGAAQRRSPCCRIAQRRRRTRRSGNAHPDRAGGDAIAQRTPHQRASPHDISSAPARRRDRNGTPRSSPASITPTRRGAWGRGLTCAACSCPWGRWWWPSRPATSRSRSASPGRHQLGTRRRLPCCPQVPLGSPSAGRRHRGSGCRRCAQPVLPTVFRGLPRREGPLGSVRFPASPLPPPARSPTAWHHGQA